MPSGMMIFRDHLVDSTNSDRTDHGAVEGCGLTLDPQKQRTPTFRRGSLPTGLPSPVTNHRMKIARVKSSMGFPT